MVIHAVGQSDSVGREVLGKTPIDTGTPSLHALRPDSFKTYNRFKNSQQ